MLKETLVDIFGATGGLMHNSLPVYADNKAPGGNQLLDPKGKQLMLPNSEVNGVHYIIIDYSVLTPQENVKSKFVTFKPSGEPNYVRLWFLNKEGHGDDYDGYPMWVEYSHLKPYIPDAPVQLLHKLMLEETEPHVWKVTEV